MKKILTLFSIFICVVFNLNSVNAMSVNELMSAYPNGSTWTGGGECAGFAAKMYEEYYGIKPGTYGVKSYNLDDIQAGDIVRYVGNVAHSVWIVARNGNTVTIAEANYDYNNTIRWTTRDISNFSNLEYIYKAPYVAGTTPPSLEPATNIQATKTSGKVKATWDKMDGIKSYWVRVYRTSDVEKGYFDDPVITKETSYNYCYFTITEGGEYQVFVHSKIGYNTSSTGGVAASFEIKNIENLELTINSNALYAGEKTSYSISYYPSDTDDTVSITSSDTSIVSVNTSYKYLKANKVGTVTITATASGGKTVSKKITVKAGSAVTSITIDKTSKTLYVNDKFKINVSEIKPSDAADKTVTWSSSNTSVATVDSNGNVTAVGPGTANIKATAGTKYASCTVKVKSPTLVESISLNKTNISLSVDEELTLKTSVKPSYATNTSVVWSSSNTSVATVSSSGVVTAKKSGKAIITAKTTDGTNLSSSCSVDVKLVIDGVSYSSDKKILYSYSKDKTDVTFTIPNGVEEISDLAFSYATNLSSVVIPSTVTKIGNKAFFRSNIVDFVIPSSVDEIGDYAFGYSSEYAIILNKNAVLGENLCSSNRPLYGYAGSTAEEYAKENDCLFGVISKNTTSFTSISDLDITIDSVEYESVEDNRPNVIIKDGDYVLKEGTDYTFTVSNNTNPTNYAVAYILGIGKYVGYTREEYIITKKKIHYTYTNLTVDYTGSVQSPIVTTLEDDVTIYYGYNSTSGLSTSLREYTYPGTYTFGVKIVGDNYETLYLDGLKFTINSIDFTKAIVDELDDYPYLGGSFYISQSPTVSYNGVTLKKNTDYTYSISDYYGPGEVTMTITGKGKYSGTIKKTYYIYDSDEYTIKLNKDSISSVVGGSTQLSFITDPSIVIPTRLVSWYTSKSSVATVDDNGLVSFVGTGDVKITAYVFGASKKVSVMASVMDYLKGDLNRDGKVTLVDVILALRLSFGYDEVTDDSILIGDINGDGKITLVDIILILRISLGYD